MSRIDDVFARLRAEKRTGLVTYVTAGDPDLPRSAEVIRAVDRGGADIIVTYFAPELVQWLREGRI